MFHTTVWLQLCNNFKSKWYNFTHHFPLDQLEGALVRILITSGCDVTSACQTFIRHMPHILCKELSVLLLYQNFSIALSLMLLSGFSEIFSCVSLLLPCWLSFFFWTFAWLSHVALTCKLLVKPQGLVNNLRAVWTASVLCMWGCGRLGAKVLNYCSEGCKFESPSNYLWVPEQGS